MIYSTLVVPLSLPHCLVKTFAESERPVIHQQGVSFIIGLVLAELAVTSRARRVRQLHERAVQHQPATKQPAERLDSVRFRNRDSRRLQGVPEHAVLLGLFVLQNADSDVLDAVFTECSLQRHVH